MPSGVYATDLNGEVLIVPVCVCVFVCGNLAINGEWVQDKVGADSCGSPAVRQIKRQMR